MICVFIILNFVQFVLPLHLITCYYIPLMILINSISHLPKVTSHWNLDECSFCVQISSDMTMLDIDVPLGFGFVSTVGLEIAGVIVIIAVVTWEVLIVVVPLLFIVRWLQVWTPLSKCSNPVVKHFTLYFGRHLHSLVHKSDFCKHSPVPWWSSGI